MLVVKQMVLVGSRKHDDVLTIKFSLLQSLGNSGMNITAELGKNMFFCVLNIFILSRLTIDLGDSGKIFLFLHYHSSITMVIMNCFSVYLFL